MEWKGKKHWQKAESSDAENTLNHFLPSFGLTLAIRYEKTDVEGKNLSVTGCPEVHFLNLCTCQRKLIFGGSWEPGKETVSRVSVCSDINSIVLTASLEANAAKQEQERIDAVTTNLKRASVKCSRVENEFKRPWSTNVIICILGRPSVLAQLYVPEKKLYSLITLSQFVYLWFGFHFHQSPLLLWYFL